MKTPWFANEEEMELLQKAQMYINEGYTTDDEDEFVIQEEMLNEGYEFEEIDKLIYLFEHLWDHAVYGGLY